MKKNITRNVCLLMAVLTGSIMMHASYPETAHDMLLYDLVGPVKKAIIKSESPVADETKLEFDADGQMKDNMFTHDIDGYVVGFGSKVFGKHNDLTVIYNDAGMPSKYIRRSNIPGNRNFDIVNTYDGKRLASRDIVMHSKKGDTFIRLVYSDEKYDSHGNWTERTVLQTQTDKSGVPTSGTYTERRDIEYR